MHPDLHFTRHKMRGVQALKKMFNALYLSVTLQSLKQGVSVLNSLSLGWLFAAAASGIQCMFFHVSPQSIIYLPCIVCGSSRCIQRPALQGSMQSVLRVIT
eukprot:scpid16119/ scgid21508/ 